MKNTVFSLIVVTALVGCSTNAPSSVSSTAKAQSTQKVLASTKAEFFSSEGKLVTNASYPTDETSHQMLDNQDKVGINKFLHKRELSPTDKQTIVRMNRDTYYSFAVVDISEGATVTLPEVPKGKYITLQGITEDHRILAMENGPGTYKLSTHTGNYVYIVVRLDATFSNEEATAIQDKMQINAKSAKPFTAEPVNKSSFETVENNLKAKAGAIVARDGKNAVTGFFTAPNDDSNKLFTQEKYEVGAALGWGGAQFIDNIYELSPNYPTGSCYVMNFKDPQDRAFWSVTVYNKKGFMFNDVANVSSNTADLNADGTYTVSFGCGKDALNNIPTDNDTGIFNLALRHYQPSQMVMDGYRVLPTIKLVK